MASGLLANLAHQSCQGDTPNVAEAVESIIYEEALRGITRQQNVIDALRTRSGTLFAAASLVTAFLGGQALARHPQLDILAWLAIVAFVTLFGLVLAILWPWRFRFTLSPQILIEDHLDKSVPELQKYLAEVWDKNYNLNDVTLGRLHVVFRLACIALPVEVLAWLLSLGRG
jgi:hypothetical protein